VLQLQRREGPQQFDSEGRPEEHWVTYDKIRARVAPLSVTSLIAARAAGQTITHSVTCRYRPDLATPPLPGGKPTGHDLRFLEEQRAPSQPPRVYHIDGVGVIDEKNAWMSVIVSELVGA